MEAAKPLRFATGPRTSCASEGVASTAHLSRRAEAVGMTRAHHFKHTLANGTTMNHAHTERPSIQEPSIREPNGLEIPPNSVLSLRDNSLLGSKQSRAKHLRAHLLFSQGRSAERYLARIVHASTGARSATGKR